MIQAAAIAALAAAVVAGGAAWTARGWQCTAAEADRRGAQAEADRMARQALTAVADTYEGTKARNVAAQRVVIKEVERVVEREIYRDRDCLDPDGVRLANAAAGAATPAPQPDPAVPAAAHP